LQKGKIVLNLHETGKKDRYKYGGGSNTGGSGEMAGSVKMLFRLGCGSPAVFCQCAKKSPGRQIRPGHSMNTIQAYGLRDS